MAEEKTCKICKRTRPVTEFETRRGQRKSVCVKCTPPKGKP